MLTDENSAMNRLLVLIATLQGLVLFGLKRTEENKLWPEGSEMFTYPLWTGALILPLMLMLGIEKGNVRSLLWYTGGFSLLVMLLASYLGAQISPEEIYQGFGLVFIFTFSMIIATFKAMMYIQQRASKLPWEYEVFFLLSWRNFLVTSLALFFLLAVALVLLLWQLLFSAIGIDFFDYLFQRDWFLFPLFGFCFGLGVVIFRGLTPVIDSITRLLQGLLRFLLPVLVLLSFTFLMSLVFVGLEVLWATKFGSWLMLWLLASILFFLNAVYQDGRSDTAYSSGMHKFVSLGLITLPILSGLAVYGLSLRISQYGLTVSRLYGLVTWLFLSVFALGYLWAMLKKRQDWIEMLGVLNIRIGWFVLAVMLLISSPLVDFRKITLSNQLARFDAGVVTLEELDVRYFREELGVHGFDAYQQLAKQYQTSHPKIVGSWVLYNNRLTADDINLETWLVRHPSSLELPPEVKTNLQQQLQPYVSTGFQAVIFAKDLNGDATLEFVIVADSSRYSFGAFFLEEADGIWHTGQLNFSEPIDLSVMLPALQQNDIRLVEPAYSDLEIGGIRFSAQSNSAIGRIRETDRLINPPTN